jgi:hypothetical protein
MVFAKKQEFPAKGPLWGAWQFQAWFDDGLYRLADILASVWLDVNGAGAGKRSKIRGTNILRHSECAPHG